MRELDAANRAIGQVLRGNVSLVALVGQKIFQDLAPQTTALPYVVFTKIGGGITGRWLNDGDDGRALYQPRYQVNAVTEGGSQSSGYDIAHYIDEALRLARNISIVLDRTYLVQGFERVGDVDRSPLDSSGKQFNYIGGEYDLFMTY